MPDDRNTPQLGHAASSKHTITLPAISHASEELSPGLLSCGSSRGLDAQLIVLQAGGAPHPQSSNPSLSAGATACQLSCASALNCYTQLVPLQAGRAMIIWARWSCQDP